MVPAASVAPFVPWSRVGREVQQGHFISGFFPTASRALLGVAKVDLGLVKKIDLPSQFPSNAVAACGIAPLVAVAIACVIVQP